MNNKKITFINTLKNCLDIIRNEGLTGEKALRNISYLLVLKLIESHIGNDIDIDNYEYDLQHIIEDNVEHHKTVLLQVSRFSNLIEKIDEGNFLNIIKYLWDDILSYHPCTKNIFVKGKMFDIENVSTYKKLLSKIDSLDLSDTSHDILGNAYEEVIKDIMVGKVLGQFFTPPLVKKIMVKLIKPKIYPDGKIDTCCDPTMGTGGFLITYLQHILKSASRKNIKVDWEFIKTEGLYGKEIDVNTYQLAISNMLISSGHMFYNLDKGDSIREPILKKFDNILSNPPFGIKGLVYDSIISYKTIEYIPIKTNSAVSLFLQAIIYMLKIDGKCAIVLPDGQDLFSKTNKTLVMIRKYLMKTCDLKKIIYLPSDIFTNTSIKTCIAYFIKKKEGTDILEVKDTKKNPYKFKGREHQTTKVSFYQYDLEKDVQTLLVKVPINNIIKNSYSLNYVEYIENKEIEYKNDIEIKTLGEICEITQGKPLTKLKMINGIYNVIGGGKIIGKHNQLNRNGNDFTLTRVGDVNINYIDNPYYLTDNGFSIKSITNDIITKYIYYVFLYNVNYYLINLYHGTAQKVISKTNLKKIKIPIPSLERQEEIVKYLDFINETNETSNNKILELKKLNEFCINNQKIFGKNEIKTLGDLFNCKMGKFNSNDMTNNGDIPFYSCNSNNPIGVHNSYSFDYPEYLLLICAGGSKNNLIGDNVGLGKCYYIKGKTACRANVCSLIEITKKYSLKYIYYYLNINRIETNKKAHFVTNLGTISLNNIKSIKIPIPPLERQEEIVKYCEYNDNLIKQLEQEIEYNKAQGKHFFDTIIV